MSQLPPLGALRAFEAVARLGSVVKAAESLHVTHSAISHQLRTLEDFLGLSLFLREGKKLLLTEEGRIYALRVRGALGDMAEATQRVLTRPRPNDITIGVLPSFALHWLLPRLPDFKAKYPQYTINLRASLGFEEMNNGLLDLAIRMGNGNWEGLQQQCLMDESLLLVAAPHFSPRPQTAAEVQTAAIITNPAVQWTNWCQAAGLADWRPKPLFTYNDSNLEIESVKLGHGLALLRRSLVSAAINAGSLVQITEIEVPYQYAYWLIWPEKSSASCKLADFSAWIIGQASDFVNGRNQ
ncbi:LysR substrate-binding domain-containing protein [Janthinobacterium sp. B9-8]|uniref:LysR substrate-binding domain-containing protein n=1 Tax=Janthinobacterium sp. B9-8 TaxID=1236179 RepID=UPI00061D1A4E|nr:LysR substrate-binding domain-containing protein [Janthinobacterium sp. B9-8]AMC34859.1 transcriptional regulator [Janthinobacterium sp. B9-8]